MNKLKKILTTFKEWNWHKFDEFMKKEQKVLEKERKSVYLES